MEQKVSERILSLAAKGDASTLLQEMRCRALWSPYFFTKIILDYGKLTDYFHFPEMERFVNLWAQGSLKQGVEWSRGFYKTTCFTIGMGIWHVLPCKDEDGEYATHHLGITEDAWRTRTALHDQDATQLYAFEIYDNAAKKVGIVRWHFEENDLFRALFPEIAYSGVENPWNNNCLRIRRVGDRRKDAEGTFEAIGVGGALQSRHYKTGWEDDLVGERARKSPSEMEKTIGWHARLAGAFEDATKQNRFIISNRWGDADLNSYVRANEPDFHWHTRSAWEMVDGEDTAAFPTDGQGAPAYTIEKLIEIRDKGSMTKYDFSCQYLNRPILPGEREVHTGSLHYYTVADDGQMHCSCGSRFYLSQCNRYLHYDPYNAKGPTSTSCPALVVVATTSDEHIFLVDYWTSREQYGRVYDRIFKYNDSYRPRLFTYEDVGHQNVTAFHLQTVTRGVEYKEKHKNFPPIQGVKTGNLNKKTRIRESLFPCIEKKKFAVRKKHEYFLTMLETFPRDQFDHDYDLLDALAQGATIWRFPESAEHHDTARLEEDEYLTHFGEPVSVAGTL